MLVLLVHQSILLHLHLFQMISIALLHGIFALLVLAFLLLMRMVTFLDLVGVMYLMVEIEPNIAVPHLHSKTLHIPLVLILYSLPKSVTTTKGIPYQ